MIELQRGIERGLRLREVTRVARDPTDVEVILGAVRIELHRAIEQALRVRQAPLQKERPAEAMIRLGGVGTSHQHLAQELLPVHAAPRGDVPAPDPQHQVRIVRRLCERRLVGLERLVSAPGRLEQETALERESRVVGIARGDLIEGLGRDLELP